MFARFFERGYAIDIEDIARYLDCDTIEMMKYEYIFQNLLKKRLIALDFSQNLTNNRIRAYFNYSLSTIIKSILNNVELKPPLVVTSSVTLLGAIREYVDQYIDKQINFEDVEAEIRCLLSNNSEIYMAQKLEALDIAFEYKLLLLYVAIRHYRGDSEVDLNKVVEDIFWQDNQEYSIRATIMRQNSVIFTLNILKINPSNWRNDVDIEITKEGAILFVWR
ncbi:MAG: hypothetical protein R2760_03265 [Chitinophagales bacterium]